ncbi:MULTISPECIES: alpha/beta hydrolase fold domain-containing protein [Mycolicibacter]|uniref:Alpha/beta hydrolase fold-3 domain-containing protein n=2 Tax=Mycolicibacter TaxID=1073531 RepID=A0A1A3TSL3_MYCSD|nr:MULTISPECIES: alpha/beta hydrolase fold domain-containing protein [Mycolicibacter]OBK85357.1 hypothetical protein A5648_07385 [Mycolicibacter sinensis]OBY32349.1 hypothetical protein ACT18_07545 [Mycolicibacter kumamotonensis]
MSLAAGATTEPADEQLPARVDFPGPGLVSRLVAVVLRMVVRPVIALFARFPDARWPFGWVDRAAFLLPRPRGVRRQRVDLPHCCAELVTPKAPIAGAAILYLHGGGFITCGLHTHRWLVANITRAAGRPALAVDYRQLPQDGLAEALQDAVDGFRALRKRGYAAADISIVGDSAGGYLAVATALAVVQAGLGKPAALAVLSPMTSIDPEFPVDGHADDPLLTRATVRALGRKLAARPTPPDLVVPGPRLTSANLAELPPALIQVGTREVLREGAEELADRIAAAGVRCQLQTWDGQFHVFQAGAPVIGPARAAVSEIAAFLRAGGV